LIVKEITRETRSVKIAYFGIGPIYSHIIPPTANILQKAKSLVRVAIMTQNQTS